MEAPHEHGIYRALKKSSSVRTDGDMSYDRMLKERRSIFRTFKTFFGKGVFLDPTKSAKSKRYSSASFLRTRSIQDSVLISSASFVKLDKEIREQIENRVRVCIEQRQSPEQLESASLEMKLIEGICYKFNLQSEANFFNDLGFSFLFAFFAATGSEFLHAKKEDHFEPAHQV